MSVWFSRSSRQILKRLTVACVGLFLGTYAVSRYYQPLKGYDEELEAGKLELLQKYKKLHNERVERSKAGAAAK